MFYDYLNNIFQMFLGDQCLLVAIIKPGGFRFVTGVWSTPDQSGTREKCDCKKMRQINCRGWTGFCAIETSVYILKAQPNAYLRLHARRTPGHSRRSAFYYVRSDRATRESTH